MGSKQQPQPSTPPRKKTPTFLLELPLFADAGEAARVDAHLEVGRQFYNAVLSAGQERLRRMRADPAWQGARAIPRMHKQERKAAFAALRERYGFNTPWASLSPGRPFTSWRKRCGFRGWLSTWMPCWRKPWPAEP